MRSFMIRLGIGRKAHLSQILREFYSRQLGSVAVTLDLYLCHRAHLNGNLLNFKISGLYSI